MEKKIIATTKAPAAIGPYSQAIKIDNFLYTSGQISLDAETMEMVTGSIEIETEKVLQNLEAILMKDGLNLTHVIKTTVYLSDLGDFHYDLPNDDSSWDHVEISQPPTLHPDGFV